MTTVYAIGGIILIATVYEINRKVGLALFALAILAMIYTYFGREISQVEITLPRSGQ
jgi:TRAP-type uncharacterized transport system fused permease subunit